MRASYLFFFLFTCLLSCQSPQKSVLDYVDLFIGTGGHGHTHPSATVPFGMMQLGPDTRLEGWDGCSGYHYSDSIIYGFSHTHLSGTGVGDYNDLLITPSTSSNYLLDKTTLASTFTKANEKAAPGYYQVLLEEENIQVELTASERGGIHKYTSLDGSSIWVALDLMHRDELLDASFTQVDQQTITGKRISKAWAEEQHFYFCIQFSEPIRLINYEEQGKKAAILFENDPSSVELRVAMSAVDEAGAVANYTAELKDKSFDELRNGASDLWLNQLDKIQISASEEVLTNFYTAMYHVAIVPNSFTDVDGRYRGTDQAIHTADGYKQYTIFSLWDTYRTAHPLYTLINPAENKDFIKSMLAHYSDGGQLPVWELAGNYTGCMIGYHTVSVIADAYLKGQQDFDATLALEAMQHISNLDELGKPAYAEQGFVPAHEEHESVSKTLEYAYNDWCIAQMAKSMGELEVYQEYIQRAQHYKYLFNPANQFMVPRVENRWLSTFDPYEVNFHFTEANAWQYHLYVPHDIKGLIRLFGGEEALRARLDEMFSANSNTTGRNQADITGLIGQYAHGNEPSHHMAYLYNYVGAPASAQKLVRQILEELYQPTPDGISGNEDCGQMSAWYIMSSLGLYPMAPGSAVYDLGAPIVDHAQLTLKDEVLFEVKVHDGSSNHPFVQEVYLNGEKLDRLYITHQELEQGGLLEFYMGSEPLSKEQQQNLVAYNSAITDELVLPSPAFSSGERAFKDKEKVALNVASDATIFYKVEGQDKRFKQYSTPFVIQETSTVLAYAANESGQVSKTISATFRKIPKNRSITLNGDYSNQYAAGGDQALIDFLYGGNDFRTGEWQGYEGGSVEAIVDLGSEQLVSNISINALQDENSWIFMPKQVDILYANSKEAFNQLKTQKPQTALLAKGTHVESFDWSGQIKARYIKIVATNMGSCPADHKSAGNDCWIFLDEITIN